MLAALAGRFASYGEFRNIKALRDLSIYLFTLIQVARLWKSSKKLPQEGFAMANETGIYKLKDAVGVSAILFLFAEKERMLSVCVMLTAIQ